MLALIMAGGAGSRLGMGEKPLVTIGTRPMIAYVLDAFASAGHETLVVTSPRTPVTKNWCRANGIERYDAEGSGYIDDLEETVLALDLGEPLFTCVADLPCLNARIIHTIEERYRTAGTPACSTWVPHDLCREHGCRTQYTAIVDGVDACPVGINIVDGTRIGSAQEEVAVLIRDRRLAFNINTREELALVRSYLCR